MTLVYCWLLVHRYRVEQLEQRFEREGLETALKQRRAEASDLGVTASASASAGAGAR
jgi:hypothetical protein